ncbi:MAG: hypothetical protein ABJ263_14825 [Tateyamaria sp.]|uniref:hypothetical protein n=1 Tax=Tateyamaria sp. TaxID=1929288 RepID=UPI003274CBBF
MPALKCLALLVWPLQLCAEQHAQSQTAAQCAGFWLGYHDYGQLSAYLEVNPADIERANAFRAVAIRIGSASPTEIDTFIAKQRSHTISLMDAVVYRRDRSSQRVFEDLTETCETLAKMHPETSALR